MLKKFFYPLFLLFTFIKVLFFTGIVFFAFSVVTILILRFIPPATTAFIEEEANMEILSIFKDNRPDFDWVSIDDVTPYMGLAVIASEDQRFATHWGFDFEQIEKAIKEKERGRRVRGASTITQQVSKNLFLWKDKTLLRKGIEAYYTILIEVLWSKKRILEAYINIAELGKGVYGVKAASNKFFKKEPEKLSMGQCAILAAVIPRPQKFKANRPSAYILRRQGQIIIQMGYLGGKDYLKQFM
ncbi:MAG TPA: monofunctional biosynthetic peptidoglycan transglycosylase [Melioribacteraceae bacterium]|nr:monofunctional biosynthetic peptidoglycan transglycosylase [Melioribacteraceae bacterium]